MTPEQAVHDTWKGMTLEQAVHDTRTCCAYLNRLNRPCMTPEQAVHDTWTY